MGRRGRAILGLVAVAVVIAVVAGTVLLTGGGDEDAQPIGAVAAVQDDHLPVAPVEALPARLDLIDETGATTTRVDLFWSQIAPTRPENPSDPADPAYDFSRTDLLMQGLAERDITPIVAVYNTPAWATDGPAPEPGVAVNTATPDPEEFGRFMGAVARRYSGEFASPAGERLPEVRHFEIWNEPNLKGFFNHNGKSKLGKYKALVRQAYPRIKRSNRRAIVIAGVGGPRSSGGNGNVSAKVWMNGLVNDRKVKFDAYSQHIYPSRGPKYTSRSYARAFPTWDSLPLIFRTLDRKKKGMKLYVTEAGYTTARTPFRNVKVTLAQQKLYMKQLFGLRDVKSPRVAAVVWFNMQDNPNWPGGILRANGKKKPSYSTFQSIARRPIPANLRSTLRN